MMWSILAATFFVVGVSCGPVDLTTPATELEPPKYEAVPFNDDIPAPATDLVPPEEIAAPATDLVPPEEVNALATDLLPPFEDKAVPTPATELLPPFEDNLPTDLVPPEEVKKPIMMLFLINVFAVKNHTAEDSNDVLHADFMEEVPEDTAEPLSIFLLVVEDEDEDHPVSLDEVAKDLESEGFVVDRVVKNGETQLIKVDLASVESRIKVEEQNGSKDDAIERIIEEAKEKKESDSRLEKSGKLTKVRRKRHICLKCMLDDLKMKNTYGGGCGGGCGGGGGYYQPSYQPVQVQPVQVQPVQVQPVPIVVVPVQTGGGGHRKHHGGGGGYYPQPNYPPPQPNYQPQPTCNVCQQGGHYPNGGGSGGNSYAHASATATASAQSYSY